MAMRASALRLPSRLLLLKSATLCNATAIIRSRNIFCAANPNVAGPQPVPRLQSTFPPLHHAQVRFRSWTELKDCKHWLITLKFPDPKPAREEMINTYVKTLANVLGSEEEAKKKIYALSTTVYTGFQCNIDEATSEKLKEQPLVDWVLPDGYGDPELGIFGGDRYNNGVVTPDPNPPRPYRERQREMNYDRRRYDGQRDFRGSEGARGRGYRESGGYGARPAMENEGSIQRIPMQDDRRGFQPGDSFSRRGPIQNRSQGEWYPASDERRESQPGAAQDYRPSYSQRVVQGEQRQHPGFEGGSTWRKSD